MQGSSSPHSGTMVSMWPGIFSLAATLCVLLQEGFSFLPAKSDLALTGSRHLRTKRCSCLNWEDKECIYFCHLDIIWINTPGHALPYGLGNPQKRQKRALARCQCSHAKDRACAAFCHDKAGNGKNPGLLTNIGLLAKLLQGRSREPHKLNC